ncbi:skin secretory protein xP2-like [Marmota monax]|uniref:skin secretory protein xP2-like n=1 Tax=Marmota monax TaxID=9995 RepID=UPI001EB00204|nr:skin secretory protein xP2-like [Marmota monax]
MGGVGNPNSAGRAPKSYIPEIPFRRPRAPHRSWVSPTRHFQGQRSRRCAPVLSRSRAARPPGAHNRRHRTAPRNAGSDAGPLHSDGERQARALEQSVGDTTEPCNLRSPVIRGTRHGARSPGTQPAVATGLPPSAEAARELRASPAARLCCPGAPSSRPGVGELQLAEATCSPGARRLDPRELEEERRGEGDTAFAGTGDFEKPSRNPSSRGGHGPADTGPSRRPGRGAQARAARRALRARPAPPHLASRPAPHGSAPARPRGSVPSPPEVVAEAEKPPESRRRARHRTWSALPAPPRTQPSGLRRGTASLEGEKAVGTAPHRP